MTTLTARNDILAKLDMMTYVADKLDFGKSESGSKFGHLIILINQYVNTLQVCQESFLTLSL